jgi:hypothetical protein
VDGSGCLTALAVAVTVSAMLASSIVQLSSIMKFVGSEDWLTIRNVCPSLSNQRYEASNG